MKPFENTRRMSNHYYVDTRLNGDPWWEPFGNGWYEMTPRWLDPQTLQLGVTELGQYSLAGSRRRAQCRGLSLSFVRPWRGVLSAVWV